MKKKIYLSVFGLLFKVSVAAGPQWYMNSVMKEANISYSYVIAPYLYSARCMIYTYTSSSGTSNGKFESDKLGNGQEQIDSEAAATIAARNRMQQRRANMLSYDNEDMYHIEQHRRKARSSYNPQQFSNQYLDKKNRKFGKFNKEFANSRKIGKYVSVDSNGHVHVVTPDSWSNYVARQSARQDTALDDIALSGEMKFDESNGMPYHEIEPDGQINIAEKQSNDGKKKEALINKNLSFQSLCPVSVKQLPYNSCGMLDMYYNLYGNSKRVIYHGSAFAITPSIILTAAHNFMPDKIDGMWNTNKLKADNVYFYHQRLSHNEYAQKASVKFYLPRLWEESFDDDSDYAVGILDAQLQQTKENEFVKMQCGKYSGSMFVTGFPLGDPKMKISTGHGTISAGKFTHYANTEKGNSGSLSSSIDKNAIGIHVAGGNRYNIAVPITKEVLKFINQTVGLHDMSVKDSMKFSDNALDQESITNERIRIAQGLIKHGMKDEEISDITKLTIDVISRLRTN